MKLTKRAILSVAAVLVFTVAIVAIVVVNAGKNTTDDSWKPASSWVAGVTGAFIPDAEEFSQVTTNEETQVSSTEDDLDKTLTKTPVKKSYFADLAMVDVEEVLNVREEPSADSEIVGKMARGDVATVLGFEGEWIKISSGNVNGYIKAEYCKLGDDAEAFAKELNLYFVKSTVSGLRIRETADADGNVLNVMDKDSTLPLDTNAEKIYGWYAVIYKDTTAYVSAEYAQFGIKLNKALTIEEYEAKLAAEAEAKKKKESSNNRRKRGEIAATVDEETLLAALIYCEAGNQSYEGMLAVGAVVCNRIRSGSFPNTLIGVIYQRGQFGPAMTGLLDRRIESGNIPDACFRAAREALSGVDNVGGRLYFHMVRPGDSGLIIGDHVFY